jgi:hypothetical protein
MKSLIELYYGHFMCIEVSSDVYAKAAKGKFAIEL